MEYQQSLVRAPVETLKILLKRTQVTVERDLGAAMDQLRANPEPSQATVDSVIERITKLRAKLVDLRAQHDDATYLLGKRVRYVDRILRERGDPASAGYKRAVSEDLNVKTIDYFLRKGYIRSARTLIDATDVDDLVDFDRMKAANVILESIAAKQTGPCLNWCIENRIYLKKVRSPLEFEIRLQQFLELIHQGRRLEAIIYSRKNLAKFTDAHLDKLYKSMLSLFPATQKTLDVHVKLQERWEHIAQLFLSVFLEIHGKSPHVSLYDVLGAGLSALRTYSCGPRSHTARPVAKDFARDKLCPCCSTEMATLASSVPFAHHIRSILDPDPVVLPNGHIYGSEKLRNYASQVNIWPKLADPTTLEVFEESEVKSVYPS